MTRSAAREWARFLNSLLERTPPTLARIHEGARALAVQALEELRAKHPIEQSLSRLDEVFGSVDVDALAANGALGRMVREIGNPDVIDYFKTSLWRVVAIGDGLDLLATDTPIVVNGGAAEAPVRMLTIALGPKHLFILCEPRWEPDVDDEFVRALVLVHNIVLVRGPARYVYSCDRLADGPIMRSRRLVERYLGRPGDLGAADEPTSGT